MISVFIVTVNNSFKYADDTTLLFPGNTGVGIDVKFNHIIFCEILYELFLQSTMGFEHNMTCVFSVQPLSVKAK